MSRTNLKRYLMLLGAIGLVAVVGGSSGTFASFNAEVTNSGNAFATGTLILNDNGGHNTCTSEGGTVNTGAGDCDTLFKLARFTFASTTYAGVSALDHTAGISAVISVGAITGAAIYKGDTLTITDGTNVDTLTAESYAPVNASPSSVTVDASGIAVGHSYNSGATITDNNDTYLADLTLTNAGSIDASGIKFEAGTPNCTSQYTEGFSHLVGSFTAGGSSGTTLNFTSIPDGSFKAGDSVVVSEGGHSNTFIAATDSVGGTVTVTAAQLWNGNYDSSATVSGPEFAGHGTPQALCGDLAFSVVEATSFSADLSTAVGCAYGSSAGTVAAANACNFGAGTALSSLPTGPTGLTSLSLGTGTGGNTGVQLTHGQSRQFLLVVHYTGPPFDNTYQNTEATAFSLIWHIDQT